MLLALLFDANFAAIGEQLVLNETSRDRLFLQLRVTLLEVLSDWQLGQETKQAANLEGVRLYESCQARIRT